MKLMITVLAALTLLACACSDEKSSSSSSSRDSCSSSGSSGNSRPANTASNESRPLGDDEPAEDDEPSNDGERLSDLRLLEARIEVIEEMMTIAPNWELPVEQEDDPLAWLREFLSLTPAEERELGYILDIRHFLPTDVLIQVGAQLVLIGMNLR